MDTDDLISRILEIANYPEEKRGQFINGFNHYFFVRLLTEISKIDDSAGKKVTELLKKSEISEEEITPVMEDILRNSKVKDKVEQVTKEVIGELVDDIATSATEEQKQQILSSLPASA